MISSSNRPTLYFEKWKCCTSITRDNEWPPEHKSSIDEDDSQGGCRNPYDCDQINHNKEWEVPPDESVRQVVISEHRAAEKTYSKWYQVFHLILPQRRILEEITCLIQGKVVLVDEAHHETTRVTLATWWRSRLVPLAPSLPPPLSTISTLAQESVPKKDLPSADDQQRIWQCYVRRYCALSESLRTQPKDARIKERQCMLCFRNKHINLEREVTAQLWSIGQHNHIFAALYAALAHAGYSLDKP